MQMNEDEWKFNQKPVCGSGRGCGRASAAGRRGGLAEWVNNKDLHLCVTDGNLLKFVFPFNGTERERARTLHRDWQKQAVKTQLRETENCPSAEKHVFLLEFIKELLQLFLQVIETCEMI